MTQDESRADVDASVDEFARLVASREGETSGVQPPPSIEESQTELGIEPFRLGLTDDTTATVFDEDGGGGGGNRIGACCVDSTCSVTTQNECIGLGGTFQGVGSDCDPNPCPTLPPCDDCGFDAFDGSGRKFLTKTVVTTGEATTSQSDGCGGSWTLEGDSTVVDIYEYIFCDLFCTRTSSGGYTYNSGHEPESSGSCELFPSACGVTTGHRIQVDCGVETFNADISASDTVILGESVPHSPCFGGFGGGGFEVINSATSKTIFATFGFGEINVTLSNECEPDL